MSSEPPIRIRSVKVLSDDWSIVRKTTFDYRRRDGTWETLVRQTYDRGDGAAILPYDPDRGTVLLVRQFRYPAYVQGHPEPLIEACAGALDADDPETCIRREAEEELGYRVREIELVFKPFSSPGSITERISLYVARYAPADRISDGGGEAHEGEDIEVLEMSLDDALARVGRGEIIDAKTIILLQHARLAGLMER
ncbi:MAG: NUDIX domain-containing protein [Caulobacteraceae bacterium]|nr:NUDIX domain-containing protein [Caulobacteraceae bacterium]